MDKLSEFYNQASKFIIILSPVLTIIIAFFTYNNNVKIRKLQEEIHKKQMNDSLKAEAFDLYDLLKSFIQHLSIRMISIYHPNMQLYDNPEYLKENEDYDIYKYKSLISYLSTEDIKYIDDLAGKLYFVKRPIKSANRKLHYDEGDYGNLDLEYYYGVESLDRVDKRYWNLCYIELLLAYEKYFITSHRLLEIVEKVDSILKIREEKLSLKYILLDGMSVVEHATQEYENPFLKTSEKNKLKSHF